MIKITYPGTVKYLLMKIESTWGTAVTADNDVGVIISDLSDPITREVVESVGLSSIATQKITSGIVDVGLTVAGDFQHGRLLEPLIGTVAHVETTGDWKHTFTVGNTPPSFTMERGNNLTTDTVLAHAGMLAESGELGIALNENLKLSCTLKGKTTLSSASAGTAITSTLIVYPHALCTVKVNGVAATEVQNASIQINKVVSRSGGISSNLYQQGHATELKFAFSAQLGFADKTFQELYLGGTSPSATSDPTVYDFELSATNGVTLGSGRREVKLELENCIGSNFNETSSVGNLTFIELSGVGTLKECFTVDNISSTNWV